MPKVRRVFSLLCRFGLGFFVGLTTLVGTAVAMVVFTILYRVDYGPFIAIVLGCSMSGVLYMLTLWAYKADYGEPPKKKETEDADQN